MLGAVATIHRIGRVVLISLFLTLAIFLSQGCSATTADNREKTSTEPVATKPFRVESEWILHAILTDIANMVCYSRYPYQFDVDDVSVAIEPSTPTDIFPVRVTTQLPMIPARFQTTLKLDSGQHIWSPEVYVQYALHALRAVSADPKPTSSTADTENAILETLLRPDLETIQKENLRISSRLEANMLDGSNHSDAAMLLGTLSLRESAGLFSDTRPILNRMTAHMALAKTIDSADHERLTYRLALAIQNLILGNQNAALTNLDVIDQISSRKTGQRSLASWSNALKTRATLDWRYLSQETKMSLLEKMMYYRSLCASISVDHALEWVTAKEAHQIPYVEAARIATEYVYSVGSGHRFAKNAIPVEIHAMQTVFKNSEILNSHERLIRFLNRTPGGCFNSNAYGVWSIDVIGDGEWAGYFQRHLMHRISDERHFYDRYLGMPKKADAFFQEVQTYFGDLHLFPVLVRIYTRNASAYTKAMDECRLLLVERPQTYNVWAWSWINHRSDLASYPSGIPNLNHWFKPGLPQGTLFNLYRRCHGVRNLRAKAGQLYREGHQQAPYDWPIAYEYAEHVELKRRLNGDELADIFDPLPAYNLKAMKKVAKRYKNKAPKKYIALARKISTKDPDYYFDLGDHFVELGRETEAVAAYENGVALSKDTVGISNSCKWLVNYYYDNGREQEAFALAQRAAKVYSAAGLKTLAGLLEKSGDLSGAEEYFSRNRERYDQVAPLFNFYERNSQKPEYQTKLDKLTARLFPEGMRPAALGDFNQKPEKGVIIISSSSKLREYGLAHGDIVVAIDGYRVDNLQQYEIIRDRSSDPQVHFIVWHKNRYLNVDAQLKNRKFGVDIETYPRS